MQKNMKLYEHRANYYETDKMGVIHHSNYIKWMEEARIYIMNELGHSFKSFEEMGYISPVLSVNCEYKKSVEFDDIVQIRVYLKEISMVKFVLGYDMYNKTKGELCTMASSVHCFWKNGGRPVNLKKEMPEFIESLTNLTYEDIN
jgi:acyl-CoA thioester hydrolase